MQFSLVVIKPFGTYKVGATITDATEINRVLAGELRRNVVRVAKRGS